MKLVFLDTETTGLEKDDKICQIAYSFKNVEKSNGYTQRKINRVIRNKLVNPGVSISPEAAMTTGITDFIVKDSPKFIETIEYKELEVLAKEKNTFFLAYNAPFDINMLLKDKLDISHKQVIDVYRIAKYLYKNKTIKNRNGETVSLSNNKLQYFRYLLKFDEQEDFKKLTKSYGIDKIQAHDALSDIIVLEYFYHYLVKTFDLDFPKVLELSNKPVLEPNINFGNVFEKGTPFETCLTSTYEQYGKTKNGYDYLDWCVNNLSLSVDTEYSVKIHFFNNIVKGTIPYNNNFLKYLNFGLVFEKDSEVIEKAVNIIHQDMDYQKTIIQKFLNSMNKQYEDNKDKELGDFFPYLFLKRYTENFLLEQ